MFSVLIGWNQWHHHQGLPCRFTELYGSWYQAQRHLKQDSADWHCIKVDESTSYYEGMCTEDEYSWATVLSKGDPKQAHELAIAGLFVEHLRTGGIMLTNPRVGDINLREPDAVASSPNGNVGIEIAGGYYSKAEDIGGHTRKTPRRSVHAVNEGEDLREALRRSPLLVDPDASLVKSLQRMLIDHCQKDYSLPAYVVIDATSAALTTSKDASTIVRELALPQVCPFLGVYLALRGAGTGSPTFHPVV